MPRLILKTPHTHAGKTYPAGDTLEVDADIAEWLLARDVATREPRPSRTESSAPGPAGNSSGATPSTAIPTATSAPLKDPKS